MEAVKSSLISARRIIFTPAVDLKDELAGTAVQITCYDRTGKEVKRVTSTDDGTIEDPENTNTGENTNGGGTNQGGGSGDNGGYQLDEGGPILNEGGPSGGNGGGGGNGDDPDQ